MTFFHIQRPVNYPQSSAQSPDSNINQGYSLTDPSLEVFKFCDTVVKFLEGAQDYWSSKGLMGGYGEGVTVISNHLEESLQNSNPITQATAGSFLGVGKILGAIPFGLGHWVHRSMRDTVDHDLGTGFKTFVSIPVEGFVEGGQFLLNQVQKWGQGEISGSTFGVADEVSTTLGTAALMAFGIKSIHTGGKGMINAIKNIEPATPALATATGHAMPGPLVSEALAGPGPMAHGLVYMAASKKEPVGSKTSSKKTRGSQAKKPIDDDLDWVGYYEDWVNRFKRDGKREPLPEVTDRLIKEKAIEWVEMSPKDPRSILIAIDELYKLDPRLVKEMVAIAKSDPKYSKILDYFHKPEIQFKLFARWNKFDIPKELRISLLLEEAITGEMAIHAFSRAESTRLLNELFPGAERKTIRRSGSQKK